ncbi:OPA family glycerol-3-phosphate transporter-like MFS transporter [Clavibacter michiganensis]|uniref:MFS transporter n=1 Tax=Clavibacter michiganensis TaxID=28447 RepID=UPI001AE34ABC|nr:MFS transporter [Clavibacter michiganensis]MBP2457079.1 OPA family glycerol-3-phosphate transporter-like MFS transporter [Clavibacter michiganensis]MDQ0409649.1 OPA family glycerol-3-phosphate transporter-like MFS transporter [Clavibacter michiganensis]
MTTDQRTRPDGSAVRRGLLTFMAAPPPAPRLDDATVARRYPRLRLQVFLGIFIGYAAYYLIRNNVPLVATILRDENGFSALGLGILTNGVLLAYGFSKFLSAIVSDRSSARWFLPIGLLLSAFANLVVAFVPAVGASVALFAVVMIVNGFFQGMGWPPSGRTLVHWFSTSERGGKTAIWNVAHNVGGAGAGGLAGLAIATFGTWQSAFWFPAIVCIVIALVAFVLLRDTPESEGLPPIEEHRDDPAPVETDAADEGASTWSTIRRYVIGNRTMVNLALANVFVYTLRYGVLVWAPIYLADVRGASLGEGIAGFSLFELAGIPGTLLCGYISDRVFRGRRSPTGILFMAAVGVAVAIYWLSPADGPLWVSLAALVLIGGLIYGPVMLIGLQALDLSPRKVAGTAAGFTGLFGYVLGATLASTGIGASVHAFGWDVTFVLILVCVALAILLLAIVGKDESALRRRREERGDIAAR